MSKITRQGTNKILSTSVEYHNFVYLAGITADDLSKDIKGQTAEVLAKIDAALESNGTDKTRLLTAHHLGEAHRRPRRDERALDAVAARRRGPGARLR